MNIKAKRILSLGLSLISVGGVIGTFIFATKESPKAQKELENLPKDSKKITKVKTFVKGYKKSLIFTGATVTTIIASRIISAKTEASLIATASMIDATYRQYRNKIKQTLGIDADKNVIREILKDEKPKDISASDARDGEQLYCEEHIGYFYAKPENIYKTMLIVNSDFTSCSYYRYGLDNPGFFTLKEFVTKAEARLLNKTLPEEKLNFGWSWGYLSQSWDETSVHMDISEPDEEGCRFIYWFEPPVWNPYDWEDHRDGTISDEEYFLGADKADVKTDDVLYEVDKSQRNN